MKIHKNFDKTFNSYDEYEKAAKKYFDKLNKFLEKNPNHDIEFSKCEKRNVFIGYGSARKVYKLIQKGIIKI